jgi:NAD+ diphosphatase
LIAYRESVALPADSDPPSFVPGFGPPSDAAGHRFFHVVGASIFVSDRAEHASADHHFLGMWGDEACWAVDVPRGDDPFDGAAADLYSFFGRTTETEWLIAGRAVQLAEWARTHRFCGRCGTPTERQPNDRSMKCPSCGLLAYPRLAPAMITLVTKGAPGPAQQVLLARGVQFRAPMYSCLAGFVEPGESLEAAVAREVYEEVGVSVGRVSYRSSQPWPFPHSLMIGFRAEWKAGDIVCDPAEILDAQWYTRDALPPIPPSISIARKLIDEWLAEA